MFRRYCEKYWEWYRRGYSLPVLFCCAFVSTVCFLVLLVDILVSARSRTVTGVVMVAILLGVSVSWWLEWYQKMRRKP